MTTIHRITIPALLLTLILPFGVSAVPAQTAKQASTNKSNKQVNRTAPETSEAVAQPDMRAIFAETINAIKKHPNKQNLLAVVYLDSFVGITPINDTELKQQEEQLVKELAGKTPKEQEEIIKKAFQQRVNALILTEPAIAECVKELQKLGIKVIAITDIIPPVAEFIAVRLKQLGLDFAISGINSQSLQIPVGTNLHALYKGGILYAGSIAYFEEALTILLQKTKQTQKQILFIARISPESTDNTDDVSSH